MNAVDPHVPRRERIGYTRVLLGLGAIVVVSAVLSYLLQAGKDWRESDLEDLKPPGARPAPSEQVPDRVRPPATAGSFFPGDRQELRESVNGLLASEPSVGLRGVHAVLVPHAGYVYSGAIAAASFREVDPGFERVFLIAANHDGNARYDGASILDVTHYGIPGARIPLSPLVDELREERVIVCEPRAHRAHMIEIELPFLQALKGWPEEPAYEIVPMIVSRIDAASIDALVGILERHATPKTLFVFSVDLSHFHTDAEARVLDRFSIDSVMSLNRAALDRAVTDGNHVLQAMVSLARGRGWEPTFLGARNSSAVSGDTDRVVGYASIVFHEPFSLTEEERTELLQLARRSIEEQVREGRSSKPDEAWVDRHPIFRAPRGVFVTLKKKGELRGCIGEITTERPLHEGVRRNAVEAAMHDTRFLPVEESELAEITLSITVLAHPERVEVASPDEYLEVQGRRSTFLPQVWEQLPDPELFLSRLSVKQGSPPDAWRSPDAVLFRYRAYSFREEKATDRAP